MPTYNFVTGERNLTYTTTLQEDEIIVIEGLHSLNPIIDNFIPNNVSVKVYLSPRVYFLDENGEEVEFEFLDTVEYEGNEYLILLPVDELETSVVILQVEPVDEENENYLAVMDENILDAVYAIFKERYKDILTFED